MENDFAVIDWLSRKVLAWKLSITMDTSFCIEAFTGRLKEEGIAISMDGKGRWCDNVFVERFWKSVKYEHIYLHAYESVQEASGRR